MKKIYDYKNNIHSDHTFNFKWNMATTAKDSDTTREINLTYINDIPVDAMKA